MDFSEFEFNGMLLDLEDFELGEMIGGSSITTVFRAENKKTHEIVAIKVFDPKEIKFKIAQVHLLRGITLPFLLNLPGIVKIKGFRFPLVDEERIKDKLLEIRPTPKNKLKSPLDLTNAIIFSEYMPNGNLETFINDYFRFKRQLNERTNPTIRSKIIFGIAAIMKRVHKYNIVHLKLNPRSILLDENLEPHIEDFNLAKVVDDNMEMQTGVPLYMAPEQFMDGDETYDVSVDVFAFAMIIYRMFSRCFNYSEQKRVRCIQQFWSLIGRGKRPCRPDSIPDCYWELIQNCWRQNPRDRLTFEEITEILKSDKFAIEEFGKKTNLDELHEYQNRIDQDLPEKPINSQELQMINVKGRDMVMLTKVANSQNKVLKRHDRIVKFNWKRH